MWGLQHGDKSVVLPEHQECLHQAVHERLGELLRVLKAIISKHQRLSGHPQYGWNCDCHSQR